MNIKRVAGLVVLGLGGAISAVVGQIMTEQMVTKENTKHEEKKEES